MWLFSELTLIYVDWEDILLDINIKEWSRRLQEQRITLEQIAWPISEEYSLEAETIINSCTKNDVVLLHFGKYIAIKEAREIVARIREKGAKTIVITVARAPLFKADATIDKPFTMKELALLVRFVSRRR